MIPLNIRVLLHKIYENQFRWICLFSFSFRFPCLIDPEIANHFVKSIHRLGQWFSNCPSRTPGASFQFFEGVALIFDFVPIYLVFIRSKEL